MKALESSDTLETPHCLQTNKMHFTFTFIMYQSTPTVQCVPLYWTPLTQEHSITSQTPGIISNTALVLFPAVLLTRPVHTTLLKHNTYSMLAAETEGDTL
jgi:hypothetical protein